jgi:hypothetical protein
LPHGEEARTAQPVSWNIYKFASKAVWLGTVEAPDEATAIEKAAAEFRVPADWLMGGEAMPCRKGEITRADLKRTWPHHVMPAAKSNRHSGKLSALVPPSRFWIVLSDLPATP